MIIVCPKCKAELELPASMVGEVVKCGACHDHFAATEWSGALLTDAELSKYRKDREIEKKVELFENYFDADDGYVSRMVCGTMGLADVEFQVQTHFEAGTILITVRMDKEGTWASPTPQLQRLIESVIGFRVRKTDERKYPSGSICRSSVRYTVLLDAPCERLPLPNVRKSVDNEDESDKDDWTKNRDFEYFRAKDLLEGNDIERSYSSQFVDYNKRLRSKYGFGHMKVMRIERNATYEKYIKTMPCGVGLQIDSAEGDIVLPEGLVPELERRLSRRLKLVETINFGGTNMFTFAVLR